MYPTLLNYIFLIFKNCKCLLFLGILFCLCPVYLPAQSSSLKFEYLTSDDGLSYNKVQCILQDKQGYIWFGTLNGLNRYDGYSFKIFESKPGDSLSIGNNNIISLYQDKAGMIWIAQSLT